MLLRPLSFAGPGIARLGDGPARGPLLVLWETTHGQDSREVEWQGCGNLRRGPRERVHSSWEASPGSNEATALSGSRTRGWRNAGLLTARPTDGPGARGRGRRRGPRGPQNAPAGLRGASSSKGFSAGGGRLLGRSLEQGTRATQPRRSQTRRPQPAASPGQGKSYLLDARFCRRLQCVPETEEDATGLGHPKPRKACWHEEGRIEVFGGKWNRRAKDSNNDRAIYSWCSVPETVSQRFPRKTTSEDR